MSVFSRILLISLLALVPTGASAELSVGARAPTFSIHAALGGKDMAFDLAASLRKGPVVVYFYPKSFTSVCTEEAKLFAEAMEEFEKLGASVLGISMDTIETQREFSTLGCRDKFPVGADPDGSVVRAYDASRGAYASRTSYVISPEGKIQSVLTASAADEHIAHALKSVRSWKGAN